MLHRNSPVQAKTIHGSLSLGIVSRFLPSRRVRPRPDDELVFDEDTGHYAFGEIDWQEFMDVVAGNGPCNKQRLEKRTRAHDDGAWVREAARAYAEKHAARAAA